MLEIFAALCAILFAIPAYFILRMFYEDALLLSIISGLTVLFFLASGSVYIREKTKQTICRGRKNHHITYLVSAKQQHNNA